MQQGDRLFSVLIRPFLCRLVSAFLTLMCTTLTYMVMHVKDLISTLGAISEYESLEILVWGSVKACKSYISGVGQFHSASML